MKSNEGLLEVKQAKLYKQRGRRKTIEAALEFCKVCPDDFNSKGLREIKREACRYLNRCLMTCHPDLKDIRGKNTYSKSWSKDKASKAYMRLIRFKKSISSMQFVPEDWDNFEKILKLKFPYASYKEGDDIRECIYQGGRDE
jgi:hypothetical protein